MSLKSIIQRWLLPDGTQGLPGLSWRLDPDTGLFRSASNEMSFSTGGTSRWVLSATGTWRPNAGNTYDVGSAINTVKDIYYAGVINGGSLTSWTPALTASVTNPTIGTGGTSVGSWMRVGKLVLASFAYTFGTTGQNPGSGIYALSLPIAAAGQLTSSVVLNDSSPAAVKTALATLSTTLTFAMFENAAGAYVQNNSPFTWAAGDSITGNVVYLTP